MKTWGALGMAVALAMSLAGCSEPAAKKAETKAVAADPPISGRQAFQEMYPQARGWAVDAQPLTMQSYNIKQVKAEGGKAGVWRATFVSASRREARIYTWSAVDADENDLHKGVSAAPADSWSGPGGTERPFLVSALRSDTDKALEAAMKKKETVEYTKKNPGLPVMYLLEWTDRFPDPTWRVIWGDSLSTSGYSVFVDASTGQFLQKTF
jgi:hypothetical protein